MTSLVDGPAHPKGLWTNSWDLLRHQTAFFHERFEVIGMNRYYKIRKGVVCPKTEVEPCCQQFHIGIESGHLVLETN